MLDKATLLTIRCKYEGQQICVTRSYERGIEATLLRRKIKPRANRKAMGGYSGRHLLLDEKLAHQSEKSRRRANPFRKERTLHGTKQPQVEWWQIPKPKRLRNDPIAEAPEGKQEGIRAGTSTDLGGGERELAGKMAHPSQEWNQNRQSFGKSASIYIRGASFGASKFAEAYFRFGGGE